MLIGSLATNTTFCNELPKTSEKKSIHKTEKHYTKEVFLGVMGVLFGCIAIVYLLQDSLQPANAKRDGADKNNQKDTKCINECKA